MIEELNYIIQTYGQTYYQLLEHPDDSYPGLGLGDIPELYTRFSEETNPNIRDRPGPLWPRDGIRLQIDKVSAVYTFPGESVLQQCFLYGLDGLCRHWGAGHQPIDPNNPYGKPDSFHYTPNQLQSYGSVKNQLIEIYIVDELTTAGKDLSMKWRSSIDHDSTEIGVQISNWADLHRELMIYREVYQTNPGGKSDSNSWVPEKLQHIVSKDEYNSTDQGTKYLQLYGEGAPDEIEAVSWMELDVSLPEGQAYDHGWEIGRGSNGTTPFTLPMVHQYHEYDTYDSGTQVFESQTADASSNTCSHLEVNDDGTFNCGVYPGMDSSPCFPSNYYPGYFHFGIALPRMDTSYAELSQHPYWFRFQDVFCDGIYGNGYYQLQSASWIWNTPWEDWAGSGEPYPDFYSNAGEDGFYANTYNGHWWSNWAKYNGGYGNWWDESFQEDHILLNPHLLTYSHGSFAHANKLPVLGDYYWFNHGFLSFRPDGDVPGEVTRGHSLGATTYFDNVDGTGNGFANFQLDDGTAHMINPQGREIYVQNFASTDFDSDPYGGTDFSSYVSNAPREYYDVGLLDATGWSGDDYNEASPAGGLLGADQPSGNPSIDGIWNFGTDFSQAFCGHDVNIAITPEECWDRMVAADFPESASTDRLPPDANGMWFSDDQCNEASADFQTCLGSDCFCGQSNILIVVKLGGVSASRQKIKRVGRMGPEYNDLQTIVDQNWFFDTPLHSGYGDYGIYEVPLNRSYEVISIPRSEFYDLIADPDSDHKKLLFTLEGAEQRYYAPANPDVEIGNDGFDAWFVGYKSYGETGNTSTFRKDVSYTTTNPVPGIYDSSGDLIEGHNSIPIQTWMYTDDYNPSGDDQGDMHGSPWKLNAIEITLYGPSSYVTDDVDPTVNLSYSNSIRWPIYNDITDNENDAAGFVWDAPASYIGYTDEYMNDIDAVLDFWPVADAYITVSQESEFTGIERKYGGAWVLTDLNGTQEMNMLSVDPYGEARACCGDPCDDYNVIMGTDDDGDEIIRLTDDEWDYLTGDEACASIGNVYSFQGYWDENDYPDEFINTTAPAPVNFTIDVSDYVFPGGTEDEFDGDTDITSDGSADQIGFKWFVARWGDEPGEEDLTGEEIIEAIRGELVNFNDIGVVPQTYVNQSRYLLKDPHNGLQDTVLEHEYHSSGRKTIYSLVFAYITSPFDNDSKVQAIKWKLVESTIQINLASYEQPDHSDFGGEDFSTIPWATPGKIGMIGGVSEDSQYINSLKNVLMANKFSNDETVIKSQVIAAYDNDELGDHLGNIDLSQFRVFNGSYDMNDLLMLPSVSDVTDINDWHPYTDIDHWSYYLYPQSSCVGLHYIYDYGDQNMIDSCVTEFNFGEADSTAVYDTSGNSNRGIIMGDYSLDKPEKNMDILVDSSMDRPSKEEKNNAF